MAEVIDISDSDEEAAAAEEEEEAAEAAPEATESLTPQAGRPLVDELDLVDSQRGLKCAICALHNLLQQRRFSDAGRPEQSGGHPKIPRCHRSPQPYH